MSPDERSSWNQHAVTLSAAAASAVTLTGVELDQTGDFAAVLPVAAAALTTMLVLAAWFRRRARTRALSPAVSPLMLLLLLAPFPVEWGIRQQGFAPHPLEVVLIVGVQAVACGLAAASVWRRHQPLAFIAGLFVTLFSVTLSAHSVTLVAASAFLVLGLGWMIAGYWSTLERRMGTRQPRRYPWKTAAIPVTVLLLMTAGVGFASTDRLWALAGWVPSSGGSGQDDPAARRGIGDGEALVAGEADIQSFGPIENAPFRASEEPSLYDLFNDLYDEPVVRNQKQDRSIALPPEVVQQLESEMAKSQRATKEFSTQRKSRGERQCDMKSLDSDALFYVKGRTPLHLRQDVFDLFDGVTWSPVLSSDSETQPKLTMETAGQRSWLRWSEPLASYEIFGPVEPHAIKIVHLKTNRIPAPLPLRGVHIDQLDRPDFFRWAGPRLLQMERDELPELTPIHLQSQPVDPGRLAEWKLWGVAPDSRSRLLPTVPEFDRLRNLAAAWTQGLPRGTAQIDAIVQRLQAEYVLDPAARAPEHHPCPVMHFLLESKRGPDYQFATAAALLLRSLDYSTRMVGGFYVSPERYDARRQHTPVVTADAHTWIEVHLSGQQWITVDPSPGYDVLRPTPGWRERIVSAAVSVGRWVMNHAVPLTLAALLLAGLWWWQQPLLIAGAWLRWRAFAASEPRQRILQTLAFVDRCGQLRGKPRPPSLSPERWLSPHLSTEAHLGDKIARLGRLADWACFAPSSVPIPAEGAACWPELCDDVVAAVWRWKPERYRPTSSAAADSSPRLLISLSIGNASHHDDPFGRFSGSFPR